MRVDNSKVCSGSGEGVTGDWDHMVWRGRVHMALNMEPHMVGSAN